MSIIRNLSLSDVVLNDLGGVTVFASSDYDLKYENRMDITNSKDLNASITVGDIVFLDNSGVQSSLQRSLNTQSAISPIQPPISTEEDGVAVAGTPHSILNFLNGNFTGSSPGVINVDFGANLEINTSGGEQVLTVVDASRSSKKLSAEKVNYIFYKGSISDQTFLVYNYFTTAETIEGIVVPKNATIVGVSVLWLGGGPGSSFQYDLYVDKNLHTSNIFVTSGNNEQTYTDNTLDIDISADQKLQIRARNVGNGDPQNSVTANIFIRRRM